MKLDQPSISIAIMGYFEMECVTQEFLDANQYTINGVLRYERIFGRTFVSTGGRETTEKFLKRLDLQRGAHVLDVGCGIGGSAFVMDLQYGARVRGVDLSRNMIALALERQKEVGALNTTFQLQDITEAEYPDQEFDLIYSRDAIMHLNDKQTVYDNFYKWLKPGGQIFVTEYSCRDENPSKEFVEYVKHRDYKLLSPDRYHKVIANAGFQDIEVLDLKEEFLEILRREVKRTTAIKKEYIKEFSQKDYDDIIDGWKDKIRRVEEGSHKWISIHARKLFL